MGFTRHATQLRHLTDIEWDSFLSGAHTALPLYFQAVEKAYGIESKIGITFEYLSQKRFQINGEEGNQHESFCVMPDALGYNFCKTAEKPYDLYVATLMLMLKDIAPNAFRIRADGDSANRLLENWDAGLALLNKAQNGAALKLRYNETNEGVEIYE